MCLFPSQYKTGAFHAGAVRSHELPVQIKHNRARAEQVRVCFIAFGRCFCPRCIEVLMSDCVDVSTVTS